MLSKFSLSKSPFMLGLFSGIWDTYRKNQENLENKWLKSSRMVKRNNDTIFKTSNHIFIKVLRRNKKQTRQNKTKSTQQKSNNDACKITNNRTTISLKCLYVYDLFVE